MGEHREGFGTEGRGLGHSFATDNVDRGSPGVRFIKRRPTYPWGDNPRGREINWVLQDNDTFRAYRGLVPIEGQKYDDPQRFIRIGNTRELRPNLPNREPDFVALDIYKGQERAQLKQSDFQVLFPSCAITSPSPGATFSPGNRITITADATDFRGLHSATLFIDHNPVDRHVFDRRDQEVIKQFTFTFFYDIPANRSLGSVAITVAVFNIEVAARGIIASAALTTTPGRDKARGTDNPIIVGQFGSTQQTAPQLEQTGFLRTPEGTSSITINLV